MIFIYILYTHTFICLSRINSHYMLINGILFLDICFLQAYLRKYGYIPRANPQASTIRRLEDYHSAIRRFQAFFGLPLTGQMDAETSRLMSMPRCGVPDVLPGSDSDRTRRKRYAHSGEKWESNDITYRYWRLKYCPRLLYQGIF